MSQDHYPIPNCAAYVSFGLPGETITVDGDLTLADLRWLVAEAARREGDYPTIIPLYSGREDAVVNTLLPKYDAVNGALMDPGSVRAGAASRLLDELLDEVADIAAAGGSWRDALVGFVKPE